MNCGALLSRVPNGPGYRICKRPFAHVGSCRPVFDPADWPEIPELVFDPPDCPICLDTLNCDVDGFECEHCDLRWNLRGGGGEYAGAEGGER